MRRVDLLPEEVTETGGSNTLQNTTSTIRSGGHRDMVSGAGAVTQRSKLTTKFLKYPTTVGQMQDGHYIIFEIHKITPPKFKSRPTIDDIPTLPKVPTQYSRTDPGFAEHVDY